jgi:hypothetical protein
MGEVRFISQPQLDTLAHLRQLERADDLYLAGGTAAAYHLGHRLSRDLDLFSRRELNLEAVRRELVNHIPGVEVVAAGEVSLEIRIGAIPVDIVDYPHAPLEEPSRGPSGFLVASLVDLATMKLAAIAKRGIKRDFWDLYAILRDTQTPLSDALDAYIARFGTDESGTYYVARSLTYFEDAERAPTSPAGMTAELWNEIKCFFTKHAPSVIGRPRDT